VKPTPAIGTTRAIDGTEIVQPLIFRTNCRDDGLEAAEYDDRLILVTKYGDASAFASVA
jgi:hypothetical protein